MHKNEAEPWLANGRVGEGAGESLGVKILVRSHQRHETVFSLLQENFLVTISIEILVIGSPLSYVYS